MINETDASVQHVLPLGIYLAVAAALLVLTAVTVYVSTLDFGSSALVVAMLIAAAKMSLVALFFMHLRYDSKLYAVIFVTAVTFLAVFIILTMIDTLKRDDTYAIRAQPLQAQAIIYDGRATTEKEGPRSSGPVGQEQLTNESGPGK
jgi:cytochrome c oxidase subunit 4